MSEEKLFADISGYNPTSSAYFDALKNRGCSGVVVKLTEGTSYTSPNASEQVNQAKSHGMVVSVYHFARFSSNAGAESNANYFLNAIKSLGLGTSTTVICDYEPGSGSGGASQIDAFYKVLENAGYKNVGAYSQASYWSGQIAGTRGIKWVAAYNNHGAGMDCDAWQFSSENFIGGSKTDLSKDYTGHFTDPNANTGSGDSNSQRENNLDDKKADATKKEDCYSFLELMNEQLYDKWLF